MTYLPGTDEACAPPPECVECGAYAVYPDQCAACREKADEMRGPTQQGWTP